MTNAKIMKVKVENVPKSKDFKVIQLTPKKTYYFKEFDVILKMIKEIATEKNESYKMDVYLVDYDDSTNHTFELPNYHFDKNMKTSIVDIVRTEAMKDKDIDEKGINDEYVKLFEQNLVESAIYDVASNTEVKEGKIKKSGLISKLKFRSKKGKVEKEVISESEAEEINEQGLDERAGNINAEDIMKPKEILDYTDTVKNETSEHSSHNREIKQTSKVKIVDLPDSQESDSQTDSSKPDSHPPYQENIDSHSTENTERNAVKHSGNQLNDNNEKPYKEQIEVSKSVSEKSNISTADIEKEFNERYEVPQIVSTDEVKAEYQDSPIESKDEKTRKEEIYLKERDKERSERKNQQLIIIENELKEYISKEHANLEEQILTYKDINKPDYNSYIQVLLDQEAPINAKNMEILKEQLTEEIIRELEADDAKYKLDRQVKETKLNNDMEQRLQAERNKISEGTEILKERARKQADADFDRVVESLRDERIENIKAGVLQMKANLLNKLTWEMMDFDSESYDQLHKMRLENERLEIERLQALNKKDEEHNKSKELNIQEQQLTLELKNKEAEVAKAKAIENELKQADTLLKAEEEKRKIKELELEQLKQQNQAKALQLKDEELAVQRDTNNLKRKDIESRERETDHLNELVKRNFYKPIIGDSESVVPDTSKVIKTEPEHIEVRPVNSTEVGMADMNEPVEKKGTGFAKVASAGILALLIGAPITLYGLEQAEIIDVPGIGVEQKLEKVDNNVKYNQLLKEKRYVDAYKMKPEETSKIKDEALADKDYVDAVKLARMTDDNEYLFNIYLKNGNMDDLSKSYQSLSYEEQLALSKSMRKELAEKFISEKKFEDAKTVNKTLKDKKISNAIEKKEKAIAEKNTDNNTDSISNNQEELINGNK